MHNSKLKRITVALCMALVPISVFAAGLGKLIVMSGLGEPLTADIELMSVTAEELNTLTATIAPEEAYAVQGIEKPASHNTIKVEVAKNASGIPILKLKSTQPISEPFLDMLIQVDWASGRLLREYTVLLDPPGYTGEADPNAQDSQAVQAPIVNSFSANKKVQAADTATNEDGMVSPSSSSKKSNKRSKTPKPTVEDAIVTDTSGEEYLTQSGDTLAKIAMDMKPEGVNLEQMLVGLYQTNPNAFQGNNMNRLKVGQIIRQPSEETLNAISRKEASSEIKVQTANWNAYRNKLAGIVADTAPSEAETSTQSAGGKIKTAEDKSMPVATGPKDVVKLSAGDAVASKANAENTKSLQDKIASLQEEATARERSVKEAQDRTASLEKQIADMQKLLALKSGAMADMQKQAEIQAKAEKNKPEAVVAAPVEPLKAVETAKPAEQAKPVEQASTETTTPNNADVNKPKPVVKPVPATAPTTEPSFLEGLASGLDLATLLPAGGLLVLLGGGWLYLRKKRERSLADFEQGIMTSGGLKANTVFGNTASASVDTGDTSFLTDFSQSAHGGMIDTNDVDPIAEAEVYMAYGRDAQAEEILKDAISKEPKRHELHLKLLEMYAASKNLSAFETIAGELYTSLGAEDPTWSKVAEIGIKLEPNNPLYQVNTTPTGVAEKLDANDFSDSPLAAEKDLDFSFDKESLGQDFGAENTTDLATADIEEADVEQPQFTMDADSSVQPEAPQTTNDSLDFDMGDFAGLNTSETALEESAPVTATDFGHTMPSLDVPTFDAPKFMPETLADTGGTGAEKTEDLSSSEELSIDSFEFPQTETPKAEAVLDISGLETELTQAEVGNEDDFNFNIPTIAPDIPEASDVKEESITEPNIIDLTSIDLELNDSADTSSAFDLSTIQPEETAVPEQEPIEVETKLDLVAAYIEMDDKEGAKELLGEVMKEGGIGQRKRAEELLAKLV